jgi:hypothetical protein
MIDWQLRTDKHFNHVPAVFWHWGYTAEVCKSRWLCTPNKLQASANYTHEITSSLLTFSTAQAKYIIKYFKYTMSTVHHIVNQIVVPSQVVYHVGPYLKP